MYGAAVNVAEDPATGSACACLAGYLAALLHQEGVARPRPRQLGVDDLLGLAVGLADIVAGALERDLQILDFAEISAERFAGLERGLDHDIQKRRAGH